VALPQLFRVKLKIESVTKNPKLAFPFAGTYHDHSNSLNRSAIGKTSTAFLPAASLANFDCFYLAWLPSSPRLVDKKMAQLKYAIIQVNQAFIH